MMNFKAARERAKWLSQITGAVFLITYAYMQHVYVFQSGNTGGMLALVLLITSALTLILGLLALPRWQGFVALIIVAFAFYCFTKPLYAVS